MILEYDNIVLGSSLNAILFAAQNFYPLVFSDLRKPFRVDYFDPATDLSFLNLPHGHRPKSLTTLSGQFDVGVAKYLAWEHMIFLLSMRGHVPLSNLCKNIRASDNKISCYNEYSKIAEIRFNNCYYFGDDNVQGLLEQKVLDNYEYTCYDWIAFNKGGKHDIDFIETNDDFVKRVWFYSSDRIDGNTAVRDACILSALTEEQTKDFNYSETMAKFKLISEMESRGMKGQFNGYGPNGNPKYYKFKTTHIRREKYEKEKNTPFKANGFKTKEVDEKQLYENLQSIHMDYNRFLRGSSEHTRTHCRNNPSS